jgi:hypothetical protein
MDVNNRELEALLNKTDRAFKDLLEDPNNEILNQAYDSAKHELDHYLMTMKESLRQKYKDF